MLLTLYSWACALVDLHGSARAKTTRSFVRKCLVVVSKLIKHCTGFAGPKPPTLSHTLKKLGLFRYQHYRKQCRKRSEGRHKSLRTACRDHIREPVFARFPMGRSRDRYSSETPLFTSDIQVPIRKHASNVPTVTVTFQRMDGPHFYSTLGAPFRFMTSILAWNVIKCPASPIRRHCAPLGKMPRTSKLPSFSHV